MMRTWIQAVPTSQTPESLAASLRAEPGLVLLRSARGEGSAGRYSFVTAHPFLSFRAYGSCCELADGGGVRRQFGNPWRALEQLLARYEMPDDADLPFPLGGAFGYWGYELKHFVEPKLPRRARGGLEAPDCQVGFYDSLVVFDHQLGTVWVVATGLLRDGSRHAAKAKSRAQWWEERLRQAPGVGPRLEAPRALIPPPIASNLSAAEFIERVARAQRYIRAGDIYQVNLSHRLCARGVGAGWDWYERLTAVSPAPFAAYLAGPSVELISASPELFLRLSGRHILTRPIKGTRPRSADETRDTQLSYELRASAKEMAELVMITDLLRNDLGRICEYGSVRVLELACLERFAQVQHLVSTVEGRLRPDVTHLAALAACFPGGSVTGAPKFRAMEIIDELEPIQRGPYTGCLGYLGFNRESQLAMTIRTVVRTGEWTTFQVGAGIVADSVPEAEYAETMTKAQGFLAACASLGALKVGGSRLIEAER